MDSNTLNKTAVRKYVFIAGVAVVVLLLMGKVVPSIRKDSASSNKESTTSAGSSLATFTVDSNEPVDFTLDHAAYDPAAVTAISNFEKKESWEGSGIFDATYFYEGTSSLNLISTNHKESTGTLKKELDLSKAATIEFMLKVTNASELETLAIDFGDEQLNNYYRYTFANIIEGWNMQRLDTTKFVANFDSKSNFDWSKIRSIRLMVNSRPDSAVQVWADAMRAINDDDTYLKDWQNTNGVSRLLGLNNNNNQPMLFARRNGESYYAALKSASSSDHFRFSAMVSPQLNGQSGLFVRGNYLNGQGYYFVINGVGANTWMITKHGKEGWLKPEQVVQGSLGNVTISQDQPYWLMVKAQGEVMEFYFSMDGASYLKLGEMKDSEFTNGAVGIAAFENSLTWFDQFMYKKL